MNEPQITNTFSSPEEAAAFDLVGLLTEWHAREPEKCYPEKNDSGEVLVWYVMRNGRMQKTTRISGFDEDRIAGAVIEAVEARRLKWELSSFMGGQSIKWYCAVIHTDDPTEAESNQSPAIALLTAYLEALRALEGE